MFIINNSKFVKVLLLVAVSLYSFLYPSTCFGAVTANDYSLGSIKGAAKVYGGCYGNGKYVVLCNARVASSADGIKWTWSNGFLFPDLYDVAYGNGVFVAVGTCGSILVSSDAVNWKIINPITDKNLQEIAFGNDTFVAIDTDGSILRSSNGTQWSKQKRPADKTYTVTALAFGNGRFFASGWNDDFFAIGLVSNDGVNWTEKQTTYSWETWELVYGNEVFLADVTDTIGHVNRLYVTFDGFTGTLCQDPPMGIPYIETFIDGVFFGIDNNGISWSKDGKVWKSQTHSNEADWVILIPGKGTVLALTTDGKVLRINTTKLSTELQSLECETGSLSPTFSSNSTSYTLTVPYETTKISMKAQAVNPEASVVISEGTTVIKDSVVQFPTNKVETNIIIKVTTPEKMNKDYQIKVLRAKQEVKPAA